MKDEKLYININMDDSPTMIDDLKHLQMRNVYTPSTPKEEQPKDILIMKSLEKKKESKTDKKRKKKKGNTLMALSDDFDLLQSDEEVEAAEEMQSLLDVDDILAYREQLDEEGTIISNQKKGYRKLKNGENPYKKEFAEELTLLYGLLDDTLKFGTDMEKDLKAIRGTKVRGTNKYTNDLASLVLTSKQTRLNILKEIFSLKKGIVDLNIKAENKNNSAEGNQSAEALAAHYMKNILSHGRANFIDRITDDDDDEIDSRRNKVANIERSRYDEADEDEYNRIMEERLTDNHNPFKRSEEGDKYIEYENRGITIKIKRCIDTGEWEPIAVDKVGQIVTDYPLPSRRSLGRMRFSEDGSRVSDALGRIYAVVEYYLPDGDDDDDDE